MRRPLGIVLAGGAGRRLGLGVPKALAVLAGRTLLERALDRLRPLCDALLVVASPARPLPASVLAGVELCFDPEGSAGTLAGLIAGLGARRFECALVLGVDYPLLPVAALEALLTEAPEAIAVVPAPGGRLQPLAARYAPEALPRLRARWDAGERSLVAAVESLGPHVILADQIADRFGGDEAWLNLNTPGDLERAERSLAGASGGRAA